MGEAGRISVSGIWPLGVRGGCGPCHRPLCIIRRLLLLPPPGAHAPSPAPGAGGLGRGGRLASAAVLGRAWQAEVNETPDHRAVGGKKRNTLAERGERNQGVAREMGQRGDCSEPAAGPRIGGRGAIGRGSAAMATDLRQCGVKPPYGLLRDRTDGGRAWERALRGGSGRRGLSQRREGGRRCVQHTPKGRTPAAGGARLGMAPGPRGLGPAFGASGGGAEPRRRGSGGRRATFAMKREVIGAADGEGA
jgi:hypothetical protein